MDSQQARLVGVLLVRKQIPADVRNIDGRNLKPITFETFPIRNNCAESGHTEMLSLNIIEYPHFLVVLGLSWLKINNPFIDWHAMSLAFSRCCMRRAVDSRYPHFYRYCHGS